MNETRGPDPQHRLLVERIRHAAEADTPRARARELRKLRIEDRVRGFIELMQNATVMRAIAERPYESGSNNFPRFSSVTHDIARSR